MAKPRIFVSYSARANEAGETPDTDRARELVEWLDSQGFEPWWDQTGLELDKKWNDEISQALATCHGAITLLSPVAIQSEYVRHEVGYLSVRRRTEPDFPLCSFLCDGLDVGDVGPFFRAIQFGDFQFKSWEMQNREQALLKALERTRALAQIPLTTTEKLESDLASEQYLGKIDVNRLRSAAQSLEWLRDGEDNDWQIDGSVHRLFARRLLSLPIDRQLEALVEIEGSWDEAQVLDLFERIAPFWIDHRAADGFSRRVDAEPGKRAAVLNGQNAAFTPEMFARRHQAHRRWRRKYFWIQSHEATGRDGGLGEQARRSLLLRLGLSENATAAEIRAELEGLLAGEKLCIVIAEADSNDLETLADLQKDFGEVLFVALTGDREVVIPQKLEGCCTLVEPPLSTDPRSIRHNEQRAQKTYKKVLDVLGDS